MTFHHHSSIAACLRSPFRARLLMPPFSFARHLLILLFFAIAARYSSPFSLLPPDTFQLILPDDMPDAITSL
jgi:hypothetical protein